MIARFNYTDRRSLKLSSVRIQVHDGVPRTFDAEWDFEGLELPPGARVYVEAMSGGSPVVMRFPFGTVADRKPPASGTALSELTGENLHFTVKVVDESGDSVGRICGLAENIQPKSGSSDQGSGRQSILPVNPTDLGERIWRLTFKNNRPWLEVNDKVPGIMTLVREDERFFSLVFPEVIRQILFQAAILDGHLDVENDDNVWQDQWLRYAIFWHPDNESPPADAIDPLGNEAARLSIETWIEEVVSSFCTKRGTRERFVQSEEIPE